MSDAIIYRCNICEWVGSESECELDDWGDLSCPVCGESELKSMETE
jgi:predicted RNA-binding Zn-ribbon protein involved in translation (DUF1610 family)